MLMWFFCVAGFVAGLDIYRSHHDSICGGFGRAGVHGADGIRFAGEDHAVQECAPSYADVIGSVRW